MKVMIRLLAVDIDGTLLDSRFQLPEANRQALLAAAQRGIEVVLVTGRRFHFAREVAAQLPLDLVIIASNGAVVKTKDGTTLARRLLPRQLARDILAAAGPDRRSALLLFDREGAGQIVTENLDTAHAPVEGYFERNQAYLAQVQPLEDALTEDPIQVLFAGALEPMRHLAERLQAAPWAAHASLARAEYPRRNFTLLDVLARGCNKGAALASWAKRRGVPASQVMAIGDNWNDREMLEFAGLPVVMANSDEDLKRRGWLVTASNDDDGVAAAVSKHLLKD